VRKHREEGWGLVRPSRREGAVQDLRLLQQEAEDVQDGPAEAAGGGLLRTEAFRREERDQCV
jgi:hypothetical protein